jgi:hypothetical protein
MITLFRNEEGYTLSVKPNHSYGGKAINFSFKGANTLSLKAVKDLGTANPRVASAIAQMIHKPKFQSIYHNRETVDEVRFSKGYLAAQRGKNHGKGNNNQYYTSKPFIEFFKKRIRKKGNDEIKIYCEYSKQMARRTRRKKP